MDRPDQATAQLKSMQEADEDSTLSQLTAAWIDLYVVRVSPSIYVECPFSLLVSTFCARIRFFVSISILRSRQSYRMMNSLNVHYGVVHACLRLAF